MSKPQPIAAELLEASAAGYAAAATAVHRETLGGEIDAADWTAHFRQRVLELAAAVRVDQPHLFAGRIAWLRRAFEARGTDPIELKRALTSLRTALHRELPDDLRGAVEPALALALEAVERDSAAEPAYLDPSSESGPLALAYLSACLDGSPDLGIKLVLEAIDAGLAPADAYTRIVIPVQQEVGRYWHLGEISVAEERLVSETTARLMTLISYRHGAEVGGSRHVAVFATVAGNAHELGLRVVCELFRLAGWRCLFLGANVPVDEIARAVDLFEADLVVLNATLTTQLAQLQEAITQVKQTAPQTPVIVGGLALDDAPTLWREFGADGYAKTAEQAAALGKRLVGD